MKKILLITRPIAPPWDEASKNFAYTLAKNVKDVRFGLLTHGTLDGLPDNVTQHDIYSSNDFGCIQKIKLIMAVRKIKKDYDILHYLFTPTRFNSFLIKKLLRNDKSAKAVQTIATLREDLYSDMEIKNMMFGDLIITYSDYAKNRLHSFGLDNVRRANPGIDLDKYKRRDEGRSNFVINFTGEYTRLGAIDIVADSFIKLAKDLPDIRLSLAVRIKNEEDARKKKEIVEKFKKENVLEKVSFHDDGRYEMSDIYNMADISLFPVENMRGKFDMPLAVVEAMACEKPVILSNLPILSELGNGRNSVIIEKGDLNGLSLAILDLYKNPDKRRQIGQEARKFAEEKFDIKKVARTYSEIYNSL